MIVVPDNFVSIHLFSLKKSPIRLADLKVNIFLIMSERSDTLSTRGNALIATPTLREIYRPVLNDMYDEDKNPDGFINIAAAENYIMADEVATYINDHVKLTGPDVTYNTGPWGSKRLRTALARHMTKYFKALHPLDPEDLLIMNGVTPLCEMLGFTIADPGDAVLFSRPFYSAFESDFLIKAGVKSTFVSFDGVDQFSAAAVPKYEAAIQRAQAEGQRIRALMFVNPMNPLGKCCEKDTIIGLMELCQKYNIHFLSDEVYALSIYDVGKSSDQGNASIVGPTPYISVLSFDTTPYISPNLIHVIYGLSKDFASGGLRLGAIYTHNKPLNRALSAVSIFHWCPPVIDIAAAIMLEDEAWIESYVARAREMLTKHSALARQLLDDYGLKYLSGSNAGFFLVVDARPYLRQGIDGWQAEKELEGRLFQKKVLANSGSSMKAEEPGWFRIVFTLKERPLREGLKRFADAIKGDKYA